VENKLKTVLVVEDDAINLMVFKRYLSPHFAVMAASEAEDALALLQHQPADLLLLDIELGDPNMDGVALLAAIRQLPGYQNVPAIASTAYVGKEDTRRLMAAGFDAHSPKPIDKEALLAIVDKLLGNAGSLGTNQ
jgi:CheY-like chemotaxis protein